MDRTAIIVVTICVILLFTWPQLLKKISPTPPAQPQPTNAPPIQVAGQTNAPTSAPLGQPQPAPAPVSADFQLPVKLESEKLAFLETEDSIYTFTSAGGLNTVELRAHAAKPCADNGDADPVFIELNYGVDLPVFYLGGVDDGEFSVISDGNRVSMTSTNQAGIRIKKEFTAGTDYLLHTTITLANTKRELVELKRQTLMLGTAMPLQAGGRYPVWGAQWHNGEDMQEIDEGWFANRSLFSCIGGGGTPRDKFTSGPTQPIGWIGVHNRFFTMTTMPTETLPGAQVYSIMTTTRLLNEQQTDGQYVHDTGILDSIRLPGKVLQPGESIVQQFTTYAGPKEYRLLHSHAVTYKNPIDSAMGLDGFIGFFSKLLLRSMNGLHSLGLGYALCIITITIIIKILFWPLTKRSTISMKRVAAYQPQLKEINEKYKDDPQKKQKRTMEFMREHKINPMGGCWPILIQMPIFIGFFYLLRSAVELRGAQFLWACDLSQPDTIAHVAGFPINPLPLIMGVTMLLQAQLTPVSPTMDPTQQKIMKFLPLMIIVFLYNFSSGLALYWTINNMLSILQTKLTKNIVVEASDVTKTKSALAKPAKPKTKRKK